MRRSIFAFIVSLLCLALPALGADRGALFKITGKGHTMHLFGTMHVGLPEFYPLEPRIAAAVAGASTLALEIDPLHDQAGMAQMIKAAGPAVALARGIHQRQIARRTRPIGHCRHHQQNRLHRSSEISRFDIVNSIGGITVCLFLNCVDKTNGGNAFFGE